MLILVEIEKHTMTVDNTHYSRIRKYSEPQRVLIRVEIETSGRKSSIYSSCFNPPPIVETTRMNRRFSRIVNFFLSQIVRLLPRSCRKFWGFSQKAAEFCKSCLLRPTSIFSWSVRWRSRRWCHLKKCWSGRTRKWRASAPPQSSILSLFSTLQEIV